MDALSSIKAESERGEISLTGGVTVCGEEGRRREEGYVHVTRWVIVDSETLLLRRIINMCSNIWETLQSSQNVRKFSYHTKLQNQNQRHIPNRTK